MENIIKEYVFSVDFEKDIFQTLKEVELVENDNKSTKFIFNFINNITDGENVLLKIKHFSGFTKEYILPVKNQQAEYLVTNSITVAGTLKMSISKIGEDNQILTPTQFQENIYVKESIQGETPTKEDENVLSGLISQVNALNLGTKEATIEAKNATENANNVAKETNASKNAIIKSFEDIKKAYQQQVDVDASLELAAARTNGNGMTFSSLKARLDSLDKGRGHIYGIKRKITDISGNVNTSPTWTKIYDNEGLVAQAHIGNSTSVRNDYDNIYPWNSIITINYDTVNNNVNAYYGDDNFAFDGSNGEVFTRYPKMWIKRLFPVQEEDGYYEYRMIADFEVQDFVKVESWMEGRYEMYVDTDNIGHSRSGVYPKYNANIKQFEQYAKNLGNTYCLEDWHRFVMDTLYLVEYANNNSQTMLGRGVTEWSDKKALVAENNVNRVIVDNANVFPVGRSVCIGTSAAWNSGVAKDRTVTSIETYSNNGVNGYAVYFDGEPVNIALENHIWGSAQKTGDCDSLGMRSGCLINDGRHSVIYRGKEQPLGNMFKFLSGINIKDYQTYICYEPAQYAPDTFNEYYHKLGYVNPNETEGYTKIMGFDKDNPLIALPTVLGAGNTSGYCDYCYSKNAGNRVAHVGGGFDNGSSAGLFCWFFNYSSSFIDWHIGARLLKYQ